MGAPAAPAPALERLALSLEPRFVGRRSFRSRALRRGPRRAARSAWFAHRDSNGLVIHVDVRGPTYKGSLTGGAKSLFVFPFGKKRRRYRFVLVDAPTTPSASRRSNIRARTQFTRLPAAAWARTRSRRSGHICSRSRISRTRGSTAQPTPTAPATADQRPLRTAIHADLRQPAVRRMEQGLSSAEQGRMTQSSNGSGA